MATERRYLWAKIVRLSKALELPYVHKWPYGTVDQYNRDITRLERVARRRREIQEEKKAFEREQKAEIIIMEDLFINPRTVRMKFRTIGLQEVIDFTRDLPSLPKDYFILIHVGASTYTLTASTLRDIRGILDIVDYKEASSSDADIVAESIRHPQSIDLEFSKRRGKRTRRTPAFFKYTSLLTELDLTRYGIYCNEDKENYQSNCVAQALGLDKDIKCKLAIASYLNQMEIPTSKFSNICEELNISINLQIYDEKTKKFTCRCFGSKSSDVENHKLALIDGHAFKVEKTNITRYALENYFELNHLPNFMNIINDKHHKKKDKFIMSHNVIAYMFENKSKYLKPIMFGSKIIESSYYAKAHDYEELDYDSSCVKERIYKEAKTLFNGEYSTIVFDSETSTMSEQTDDRDHKAYLICSYDGKKKRAFYGRNCGEAFLKSITSKNTLCIAHNLRYDLSFVFSSIKIVGEVIASGSSYKSVSAVYYNQDTKFTHHIVFKDSYAMISEPLRNFPDMFGLKNIRKEVMPYSAYSHEYTEDNILSMPIEHALSKLDTEEERTQFVENIDFWECRLSSDTFDHIKYSKIYCDYDCEILYKGYMQFRKWIQDIANIDICDMVSLPQVVYNFGTAFGCFEGCYSLSGVPRDFIQKCVVGGRCMTRDNKKWHVMEELDDLDGVSLYPSAIAKLPGFLKGTPIAFDNFGQNSKNIWTMKDLMEMDEFFIECTYTIGKKRHFPLNSIKNDDGIRTWSNKNGKSYLSKTACEDLIKFQNATITPIKGYYFTSGFNTKSIEFIIMLFNERIKMKKAKNQIQAVYKLLMNSFYGRMIQKPITKKEVYKYGDYKKYLWYNYYKIDSFIRIDDNITKFKEVAPINKFFSMPHIGVQILSMSKRIMNEPMALAEDMKIKIYYQDTDSMHIQANRIQDLAKAFEEKYGRPLLGDALGEFNCDFSLKHLKPDDVPIISTESYFLGKKSYIDRLRYFKNGEKKEAFHARLKGIPEKSRASPVGDDSTDIMHMYKKMSEGTPMTFDLLLSVKFEATKFMTMRTPKEFIRTLAFPGKVSQGY